MPEVLLNNNYHFNLNTWNKNKTNPNYQIFTKQNTITNG